MPHTLKVLVAFAAALAFAAPASASVQPVPVIFGSGTITGTPACTATNVPTGSPTACPSVPLGAGAVTLTATPQATPAGHWKFARWQACDGVVAGNTCTVQDIPGFPQIPIPRAAQAVFEDTVGPTLSAVTFSPSTSSDRTATFSWGTNEPLKAVTCAIDNVETPCSGSSSHAATVPEGQHTFRVKGTDLSGNVGALTAALTFRIIDTSLLSTPAAISNDKNPTFVFSTLTGLTFDCSLDSVTLADCGAKGNDNRGTRQLTNLADGKHTFRVRARDNSLTDAVPSVYTWTVDTVAPTAALGASGPGEGALQAVNRETFVFSSNEAATFECQLDGAGFAPCASGITLENLSAAPHRFEVRAIDAAGNVGPAVARNWVVFAFPTTNPSPGPAAEPTPIVVSLAFFVKATKRTTRFTTLQVKNVPIDATVKVTCAGKGCPSALEGKGFTKAKAFGTVTLAKFIKKPFKVGDKLTVTVTKPNAIGAVKVLTVRASKKPLIATRCLPPGAAKPVAC